MRFRDNLYFNPFYQKGTMLGMYEFLAKKEQITTAKSKEKSKLAYIELADFLDVIQHFPKDYVMA